MWNEMYMVGARNIGEAAPLREPQDWQSSLDSEEWEDDLPELGVTPYLLVL